LVDRGGSQKNKWGKKSNLSTKRRGRRNLRGGGRGPRGETGTKGRKGKGGLNRKIFTTCWVGGQKGVQNRKKSGAGDEGMGGKTGRGQGATAKKESQNQPRLGKKKKTPRAANKLKIRGGKTREDWSWGESPRKYVQLETGKKKKKAIQNR